MQDARYLRAQAELCFDIARQLSNRQVADNLRAAAAQYLVRATEAENSTAPSSQPGLRGARGVMLRFFLEADYGGSKCRDDEAVEFASIKQAEAYAVLVAEELGRNNSKAVSIFLTNENGEHLATFHSANGRN